MSVNKKTSRSIAGIAGIVAAATLISKVFGLIREQAIAAAFGAGPIANAYTYAYIIPGFLLILLGGINGPFHSALFSVLSKRDKPDAAPIVETVTTLVTGILFLVTIILVWQADLFIDLVGANLNLQQKAIATQQLQIMAPMALLAGLIGIGFGTLNAANSFWLPSISPIFSSLAIIVSLGILFWQVGSNTNSPGYLQLGTICLAGGTLAGAIIQWLAQAIAQWRSGLGRLRLRFDLQNPGVKEVFKIMAPATFASGMLHINLYTDMWFLSGIETGGIAIRYANFIALTPLGIISNAILVPFLPVFSRLTEPQSWPELKLRIRQGILLSALTMLPLTAIFIALANPIVSIVYERGFFKDGDTATVAPVLMAYGLGMFFYLARDVLVRVFYALGDGNTPFRIAVGNIFLNVVLDYFLVRYFATPGVVFATIGVNIVSMALMLLILNRRLDRLPLAEWSKAILGLIAASAIAGLFARSSHYIWQKWIGSSNFIWQFLDLSLAVTLAVIVFIGLTLLLKLPEVNLLVTRIKKKLGK